MKDFASWKAGFETGKRLVATFEQSADFAVHSIRRYVDDSHRLWEVAQTYTGRLVLRSGTIGDDGVSVKWDEWKTLHDVETPKGNW